MGGDGHVMTERTGADVAGRTAPGVGGGRGARAGERRAGPGAPAGRPPVWGAGAGGWWVAATESTRFFPMLTTAAGTVKPASVLVLGVGVAGLQALATAKRLGGRTTGYDVRPEVADQVRSVGAQWLNLGIEAAGEGGYARELTDDEKAQQQQALEDAIKGFDVVITTALLPGRPAPPLLTPAAVEGMKPGSVGLDRAG